MRIISDPCSKRDGEKRETCRQEKPSYEMRNQRQKVKESIILANAQLYINHRRSQGGMLNMSIEKSGKGQI